MLRVDYRLWFTCLLPVVIPWLAPVMWKLWAVILRLLVFRRQLPDVTRRLQSVVRWLTNVTCLLPVVIPWLPVVMWRLVSLYTDCQSLRVIYRMFRADCRLLRAYSWYDRRLMVHRWRVSFQSLLLNFTLHIPINKSKNFIFLRT